MTSKSPHLKVSKRGGGVKRKNLSEITDFLKSRFNEDHTTHDGNNANHLHGKLLFFFFVRKSFYTLTF